MDLPNSKNQTVMGKSLHGFLSNLYQITARLHFALHSLLPGLPDSPGLVLAARQAMSSLTETSSSTRIEKSQLIEVLCPSS